MGFKRKFILEYDEQPSLVFVQRKDGHAEIYQDGELVKGVRNISIDSGINDYTTHEIDYMTGHTK